MFYNKNRCRCKILNKKYFNSTYLNISVYRHILFKFRTFTVSLPIINKLIMLGGITVIKKNNNNIHRQPYLNNIPTFFVTNKIINENNLNILSVRLTIVHEKNSNSGLHKRPNIYSSKTYTRSMIIY